MTSVIKNNVEVNSFEQGFMPYDEEDSDITLKTAEVALRFGIDPSRNYNESARIFQNSLTNEPRSIKKGGDTTLVSNEENAKTDSKVSQLASRGGLSSESSSNLPKPSLSAEADKLYFIPNDSPEGLAVILEAEANKPQETEANKPYFIPNDSPEGLVIILETLEKVVNGEALPENLDPEVSKTVQTVAQMLLEETPSKEEEDSILPAIAGAFGTALQIAKAGIASPATVKTALEALPVSAFQSAAQAVGLSAAATAALATTATTAGVAGAGILTVYSVYKIYKAHQFRKELLTAVESKDPNSGILQFLKAKIDVNSPLNPIPRKLDGLDGLVDNVAAGLPIIGTESSEKNQKFKEMTNPEILHRTVALLKKGSFDELQTHDEIRSLVTDMEKEITVHMASYVAKMGLGGLNVIAIPLAPICPPLAIAVVGADLAYLVGNKAGVENGVGPADRVVAKAGRYLFNTEKKTARKVAAMVLPTSP